MAGRWIKGTNALSRGLVTHDCQWSMHLEPGAGAMRDATWGNRHEDAPAFESWRIVDVNTGEPKETLACLWICNALTNTADL